MPVISGRRVTNTAAYNYLAAKNLLRLAHSIEEGSFYWSMAAVVFAAFTYEAFLNMTGQKILSTEEWAKIDRASWRRKHRALSEHLSLHVDFISRPGSTLAEIFEFRNYVAHGREEELLLNGVTIADLRPLTLHEATSAEWEKKCTPEYAEIALEDVRTTGVKICDAAGQLIYGNNPFGDPSRGAFHRSESA